MILLKEYSEDETMGEINWNEQLTPSFTLKEFLKTDNPFIDNTPDATALENIRDLARRLQILRDKFGPITITSGYRSPAYQQSLIDAGNQRAAAWSFHSEGKAADIRPSKITAAQLWAAIASDVNLYNNFGEVSLLPDVGVIHISSPGTTPSGTFKQGWLMQEDVSTGNYVRWATDAIATFIKGNPLTSVGIGIGAAVFLAAAVVTTVIIIKRRKRG